MSDLTESKLLALLMDFKATDMSNVEALRAIESILSPLPHQDGASAEESIETILESILGSCNCDNIHTMESIENREHCLLCDWRDEFTEAMHQFAQLKCKEKDSSSIGEEMTNDVALEYVNQYSIETKIPISNGYAIGFALFAKWISSRLSERKIVMPSEIDNPYEGDLKRVTLSDGFEQGWKAHERSVKELNKIN